MASLSNRMPWLPTETCPCGSSKAFQNCCLTANGEVRKNLPTLFPPPPKTNHSQPNCYLSLTEDCSDQISAEHYLSRSVLQEIGSKIEISGVPWLQADERRIVGVNALTAKILCRRHNSAFAPLDDEASRLFHALKTIDADFARPSLSRKGLTFLFSGEALELWTLKVTCGVCFGIAKTEGEKLTDRYEFDRGKAVNAFLLNSWDAGAGLHLRTSPSKFEASNKISVKPPFNSKEKRVVGMQLIIRGLIFDLAFDMTRMEPLHAHRTRTG